MPLALYLLTFIVAFSPWTNAVRLSGVDAVATRGRAGGVHARDPDAGAACGPDLPPGGLTVAGLLCHGRLAADRPAPAHLTEFYLWVALGGALGGAFNAVVAPLVFPSVIEYPLAIVAACLLRPRPPRRRPDFLEALLRGPRGTRAMDWIAPVLVGNVAALLLLDARDADGDVPGEVLAAVAAIALLVTMGFTRWRATAASSVSTA